MRTFILAFVSGVIFLQTFHKLPAIYLTLLVIPTGIFIFLKIKNTHIKSLLLGFLLGFTYALLTANFYLSKKLPQTLEGKSIIVYGRIDTIPAQVDKNASFLFLIKKISINHQEIPLNIKAKLSWHNFPRLQLHVGDDWQLPVRLKRIHSLKNPGSYDYESFAFSNHIQAQGYVVGDGKLISKHLYYKPINKIRESIKNKIENTLPKSNTSHWIEALAIGERQNIPQDQWETLRTTGTNHLMAIAGLHIGCLSAFAYGLAFFIWRRTPKLSLIFPAQKSSAVFAMFIAILYSSLAGFSLPTERASLMIIVALSSLILQKNVVSWFSWCWAIFLVVLVNPINVLSESFWLSFGSVALIIYGMSGRLNPKGFWWKYGRMQWLIGIGLIPFSIAMFHQVSYISFLANSIAIPIVGFLIVPITFAGTLLLFFSEKIGGSFLFIADMILKYLWSILDFLAHLSWSNSYFYSSNLFLIIFACIGIAILLLPKGAPGRGLGLFLLLSLFLYKPHKLEEREFKVITLDVGQGLANIVQTQNHLLVFDTGSHIGNMDMGKDVLVPYLQSTRASKIDMLLVSHGDNDHIGGVESLSRNFKIMATKTSVPEKLQYLHATTCLRGDHWTWDNVNFEIIYPTSETLGLDNDSSCVLRVVSKNNSVLLTGDIEKKAELTLNDLEGFRLKSNILVAPHHGSKTSGNIDFVNFVKPSFVVYSTGYRNKYHFPHPSIVQLYTTLGVKQYNTVDSGMIVFEVKPSQPVQAPYLYRQETAHFWNEVF